MFKRLFSKAEAPADSAPAPTSEQASGLSGRSYEVGWVFANEKTSVIWDSPRPIRQERSPSEAAKSVAYCPAVIEFDRRHFIIPCPVDVHMRLSVGADGKLNVTHVMGEQSPARTGALNQMLLFMPQNEWRHPQRPVVQMATPYIFVSDDPVYVNQFPPFLHYSKTPLPGIQLCGRFPIDVWPRHQMWAFEWHDISKDLILKRGDPWFYVRFEGPDPSASVRLVEAQMTPELQSYIASITDVTNYVNQTFSLFDTARERRPERLLVRKERQRAS